ncbi:MAG TPA: hypothetical protein VGN56_02515 [Candidatus Paceibacterota bacterium]|jgi:quercetin dioxygenase-like cupin family protein|nr:hypothetical protein [Candidatus Paceibacterota bacterium]
MEIWNKPVNFEDARGTIRDILTHTPIEHITIITCASGAVRGNHYHKETIQYDYVVSGRMKILSRPAGQERVEAVVAEAGTLVKHDLSEAHALIALEDSVFLSITEGTRGGDDYEKDTYRLDEPLQDPDA